MIMGVLRIKGRDLSNLANLVCVASRGTGEEFSRLHDTFGSLGVELTDREKQAAEEAATKQLLDKLLTVIPMRAN